MIRCNHNGTRMDTEIADGPGPRQRPRSSHPHSPGQEGRHGRWYEHEARRRRPAFDHNDRQAAMKFAFQNAKVDTVTVGYKNTQEIDEAIQNVNLALASERK